MLTGKVVGLPRLFSGRLVQGKLRVMLVVLVVLFLLQVRMEVIVIQVVIPAV